MFKGKKTYIIAIAIGILAVAQACGLDIPKAVWPALGALATAALRNGIK